ASTQRMAFTIKEPIGVAVAVSAFNHPLNLIVHQTVPAIAVGAPVIVKPALTTPRSCIAFVNLLKEAGLPDGWCEYLLTSTEDSEKLVTDDRINFFSFIGSAKVGWYLRSKLSPGTRCALEHGGAAPAVIDRTAKVDDIITPLMKGGFYHSGQVCVSVQRVFAHEEIVDALVQRMIEQVEKLRMGDPKEEEVDCGPLILPREVDRVEQWVSEAVDEGAQLLIGGKRMNESFYEPTLLLNPSPRSKVSREEIFGPVVCIYTYTDLDKAIQQANDLPYAFQASIFTNDLEVALSTSKGLNAAAVMINDHTAFRVDWMPFGGRDHSGLGMGGIKYSMEDMSREKMLVFKSKNL
ncbi:MAG: aldehyde dehydrogenase family protein, partial [Bacteroidota bacterium]